MRPTYIIAYIGSTLLTVAAWAWKVIWWKAIVFYAIGLLVMLFMLRSDRGKYLPVSSGDQNAAKVLEALHEELQDAVCTGPISADEIMVYIQTCINHCKKNNIYD